MTSFIRVANVSEVPDPGKMLVEVDDRLVALFHVGGQWFAIDDVCTHDGGPLGEGTLIGDQVECPRHGARFDVRTGAVRALPAVLPVRTYEVQVEGDEVKVRVS